MRPLARAGSGRAHSWWWIVVGAGLLSCVYLPTLNMPFDFIDDGNLVYPAGPMPLEQRVELVWQKIVANYQDLGPFRPTLWAHWTVEAELFHGNPVYWRLARLLWVGLAAGMMLWLMRELRIHPVAALCAAAVVMWNPYRNEIWTSLSLAEGVAMPYALLALRLRRPRGSEFAVVGLGSCRRRLCTDGLRLQEHFRGTGSRAGVATDRARRRRLARRVAAARLARRQSWV